MKLRSLGLVAMLITSPAYADEAMTVAQDIASKWQTAYNNGDAGKMADLYVQDAVFSSGVLGVLKGTCRPNEAGAQDNAQSPGRSPKRERRLVLSRFHVP
jgi:hypothetical protein